MPSKIKPNLSKDQLSLKRINSNQKSWRNIHIIQKNKKHKTNNKNLICQVQNQTINKPIHQNDKSTKQQVNLNIYYKNQQTSKLNDMNLQLSATNLNEQNIYQNQNNLQSSIKIQLTKLTSWIENKIQLLEQNDYGYSNIFQAKMSKLEQNSNKNLIKRKKLTQKQQFQKLLQKYQIAKHSHNKSTSKNKIKSKKKQNKNVCILRKINRSENKQKITKNVLKHKKCASNISLIKFANRQQSKKGHHIRSRSDFIQQNFQPRQHIKNEINKYEQLHDYFHDFSINQVQSRIIFCEQKNEQSTLNSNETQEKTRKQQKPSKLNSILFQVNNKDNKTKEKSKSNRKSLIKRLQSKKSLININKKGQTNTYSKLRTNRSPINNKK